MGTYRRKKRDSNDIIGIIILIALIIIIKLPDMNYGERISGDKFWPAVGCYTITSRIWKKKYRNSWS